MFETCNEIRNEFSDYLDDRCERDSLRSIRYHLSNCEACRIELERAQLAQSDLRSLPQRRVAPDLALKLRIRLSHEMHRNLLGELWVRMENALQPLLLPASGGVLTFIICFGLFMGAWVTPVSNRSDVPVSLITPPRVRVLAPIDFNTGDESPVVVVTEVDADGRVARYHVISGQTSPELMERLDRVMYFSTFQPATMFGKPTDGQVVLSLRRITVRG